MQVKQLQPTGSNKIGRLSFRFNREELFGLFGPTFRMETGKYRVSITCEEGLVTIKPTQLNTEGTYSLWNTSSTEHPCTTGISPNMLGQVDVSGFDHLVTVKTRLRGGNNPTLTFQLPLKKGTTTAKPTAAPQQLAEREAPMPAAPAQRPTVAPREGIVDMLENVYNVNPEDRAMLKSAVAVINDQIRRSKGAVRLQVNEEGELSVAVAQFDVRMVAL